ncbi:hypothetical protein LCGC14_2980010, partial [marine sediment metagenome]
ESDGPWTGPFVSLLIEVYLPEGKPSMSLKKNVDIFPVLLLATAILFGGNALGDTSDESTDREKTTVSGQKDLLHFDNDGKGIGDVLPFYWNGEYHVFYQAPPPKGVNFVSWGHSVSTDLVNWKILPYAILAGTPKILSKPTVYITVVSNSAQLGSRKRRGLRLLPDENVSGIPTFSGMRMSDNGGWSFPQLMLKHN